MLTLFSQRHAGSGARVLISATKMVTDAMEQDYVLIVEPNLTGHRWRYAEWIMQACAEAGYPCMLVTECANEDHRLARDRKSVV